MVCAGVPSQNRGLERYLFSLALQFHGFAHCDCGDLFPNLPRRRGSGYVLQNDNCELLVGIVFELCSEALDATVV